MPPASSPYYNSTYAAAADNIARALTGDPEKAGQIAYRKAMSRKATLEGDRQEIENMAVKQGLADALALAGNDPEGYAAAMPQIMGAMAQAGIDNPGDWFSPDWAIRGAAQSGASPAEAMTRAAYAGQGKAIPLDLALTPERADQIRTQKAKTGAAGGRPLAPPKLSNKDIESMVADALMQIPGGIDDSGELIEAVRTAIPGPIRARALQAGEQAYQDTRSRSAGAQALYDALNLPAGVRFGRYDPNILPFNERYSFLNEDGSPYQFPAAPAPPAAPSPADVPPVAGARRARDGNWYVPDPARPGKFLMVQ